MSVNKNPYAKSCIRVYNDSPQEVGKEPTTITLEGITTVDTGCSLSLNPQGVTVNKGGLYHFSADVTMASTSTGVATIQLYKDNSPLPCAIAKTLLGDKGIYTLHVETDLCLTTCCVSHPHISLQVGGFSGEVTHTCFGALKLA